MKPTNPNRIRAIAFILLLASILVVKVNVRAQSESVTRSRYAYISDLSGDSFTLHFVDPRSLEIVESQTIIKPKSTASVAAFLSPNGQQIAFIPTGLFPVSEEFILYDVLTNNVQYVEAHIASSLLYASIGYLGSLHVFAWSPDSTYVAYQHNRDSLQGVEIYNVDTEMALDLFSDDKRYANLDWSADGTKLGFVSSQCRDDCLTYFHQYSFPSIGGKDIYEYLVGPHYFPLESLICNVNLSPNGAYISYTRMCDPLLFDTQKEVFIMDTSIGQIAQATDLTESAFPMTDPPNPELVGRLASYTTFWHDTDSLIIGAIYAQDRPNNLLAETFQYDVLTQSLTSISEFQVTEYVPNRTLNSIAISTTNGNAERIDIRIIPFSNILSFQNQTSYPAGCNLSWNTDNSLLAYIKQSNNAEECGQSAESIYFLDPAQNQLTEFSISIDNNDFVPVGWINVR